MFAATLSFAWQIYVISFSCLAQTLLLYIARICKRLRSPRIDYIILTKDSSLLLHACYSQSLLLADFKENQTLLWISKSLQKNPRNKKSRVYSWISFCRNGKMRVETHTVLETAWEDSSLCPETSTTVEMPLKNSISILHFFHFFYFFPANLSRSFFSLSHLQWTPLLLLTIPSSPPCAITRVPSCREGSLLPRDRR